MEEKTVKMNPANGNNASVENKRREPTYEELNDAAKKWYNENQYLRGEIEKAYKIINQMQVENGFKRLDVLFKSLEYAHYFDNEYIDEVIKEIKDMIIINDEVDGSADTEMKEEPTDENAGE